jgi:hypothetical protein
MAAPWTWLVYLKDARGGAHAEGITNGAKQIYVEGPFASVRVKNASHIISSGATNSDRAVRSDTNMV